MSKTSYCIGTSGNSQFVRAVADALDDVLNDFYSEACWLEDPKYFETVPLLKQDRSVKALSLSDVAGVFSVFMVGYFATKFLDEVYDRTAKRPLGRFLDRLFDVGSQVETKKVEIRDAVYLSDIDTVVVIRAEVGKRDTAQVASLFLQAHRAANAFLEARGRCAPVHCHSVVDGAVSIEPTLYLSIEHLNRGIAVT